MMEESGIETTPPVSPTPPVTVAATVSSPPITIGKRWPMKCQYHVSRVGSLCQSELPASFSQNHLLGSRLIDLIHTTMERQAPDWLFKLHYYHFNTVFDDAFKGILYSEYTTPILKKLGCVKWMQ